MLRISERAAQIVENVLENKVGGDEGLEWDIGMASEKTLDYPYRQQFLSLWIVLREPDGVSIDTQISIPLLEANEERIKYEVNRIWDAFVVERLEVQI